MAKILAGRRSGRHTRPALGVPVPPAAHPAGLSLNSFGFEAGHSAVDLETRELAGLPSVSVGLNDLALDVHAGAGGGLVAARPVVLLEDAPLHPLAGFAIEGMGDVLEFPVLLPLGGHGDEEPVGTVDH